MNAPLTGFRPPRLLLPRPDIDLRKWAVIACDQYTSEPDYWQAVEREVGVAPSALHLIFPEVYLGKPDAPGRIERIQAAMRDYLAGGLFTEHAGPILVERCVDGRTRRGLMLELDLEHYDFSPGSASLVRPTEGTIVARLAPRIEVRRSALLELPHILVLIDDPGQTVIEPIAAQRSALAPLYATDLMQHGGRVEGFAVSGEAAVRAAAALAALADPASFASRYGVAVGSPVMQFAVGDGNHSLATAKAIWESVKGRVGPDHPSRFALVEVENIHDPALAFAPIHRLLFGVSVDVRAALIAEFGSRVVVTDLPSAAAMRAQVGVASQGRQAVGLLGPGPRWSVVTLAGVDAAGAIAALQGFIDRLLADGGAREVDYIHGDDVLERQSGGADTVGFHFASIAKSELLRLVVHGGPLPRKTFSMGEAHEKRFYIEARRIA